MSYSRSTKLCYTVYSAIFKCVTKLQRQYEMYWFVVHTIYVVKASSSSLDASTKSTPLSIYICNPIVLCSMLRVPVLYKLFNTNSH